MMGIELIEAIIDEDALGFREFSNADVLKRNIQPSSSCVIDKPWIYVQPIIPIALKVINNLTVPATQFKHVEAPYFPAQSFVVPAIASSIEHPLNKSIGHGMPVD
jgi:hypothetical protein